MIYGYAHVSARAQDHTGQIAQSKAAGCVKVFREKITGTTAGRPQLRKLMAGLAHGDVVIPPAVDRLSRHTTDLLVIARNMQRAGAGIRSLAEPFVDTTSEFGKITLAILGVAAKLERGRILERTARDRADAKEKGVKFGRKPQLTPNQQRGAQERLAAGETQRSARPQLQRRSGDDPEAADMMWLVELARDVLIPRRCDRKPAWGDFEAANGVGGLRSDRIHPNGRDYKLWWRRSVAQDAEHSIGRGLTKA